MDPDFLNFMSNLAAGMGANLSTATLAKVSQRVGSRQPQLMKRLSARTGGPERDEALESLKGEISVLANTGSIAIDGATLNALLSARFDHQDGTLLIENSRISSSELFSGGSSSGVTRITGDTDLTAAGSAAQLRGNASIVLKGNAQMRLS